ncbi:MAG: competence/damage-inducible protein A [Omnitrophica bacterium]|nr:competence/damage-inducible protein A [Candidatus Omnitrophota bacterium]
MRAEIISIGTEILQGEIVDTNTAYLSRKLALLGIELDRHTTVGDNPARLVSALEEALSRSDIVLTTGGLGPTVDDITLYAIGSVTSKPLVVNNDIAKLVTRYFKNRGLVKMPQEALRQAQIPRGARWFKNNVGIAPAILVYYGRKPVIALPGPPRELIPIFEEKIIPYLREKSIAGKQTIKTKTIKVTGLLEAEVNRIVKDLFSAGTGTALGIYARLGEVDLKITSKAGNEKAHHSQIRKIEREIRRRLTNHVYGADSDTLEQALGTLLRKKKKTLAVAESCTGGLIANRITNVSGSSAYFKMGAVCYSNEAKACLLGVSREKIKKHGAVSKEIAYDMAKGVKSLSKAHIGAAVTGIAGPAGGTKKKPVGLVYIAIAGNKITMVKKYRFAGSREDIKQLASTATLNLIRATI